jgi:hypothetical protein
MIDICKKKIKIYNLEPYEIELSSKTEISELAMIITCKR